MPNSCKQKQYFISLTILAGMFFIFGFVSWVNSILIPYFRIACELTHFESYFVAFAFYIAYFASWEYATSSPGLFLHSFSQL